MKLMFRDEEVKAALEAGALSLTQAAITERFIAAKEKKEEVSVETVRGLVDQVQGKSKRETERILLALKDPEEPASERLRQTTQEMSELRFSIPEETRRQMERYWNLRGRGSVADMFSTCLAYFLEEKDPNVKDAERSSRVVTTKALPGSDVLKAEQPGAPICRDSPPTPPAELRSRYIPVAVKRYVRGRSNEQCEFVDETTNRRCESRYLLQYDHVHPYALGGASDLGNIRRLCAVHNQYLGAKIFAREWCEEYGSYLQRSVRYG